MKKVEMINVMEIFKSQFVGNSLYSCQIIATILAIDNLIGKNEVGISIYQKWIKSRGKREIDEATFSLLNLFSNISNFGYNHNFPLEINKDNKVMLGGAHRLGICVFLGIKQVPCIFVKNKRNQPKKYDVEYFKNILNENELKVLVEKIKTLTED